MVVSLLETLQVVVVLVLMSLDTSQWVLPHVARRVWPALERVMVVSLLEMLHVVVVLVLMSLLMSLVTPAWVSPLVVACMEGVACLGTGYGSGSFEDAPCCCCEDDVVCLRAEGGDAASVEEASCSRRVDDVVCLRAEVGVAASVEDASC